MTGRLHVLALSVAAVSLSAITVQAQDFNEESMFTGMASSIEKVCPKSDTVSMTFIGDIMLHEAQIRNASERSVKAGQDSTVSSGKSFDFSPYFMYIKDRLSDSDIAIANMEFTLGGKPFTGYPAFSAPDSYAEYVAECGIDVFLTANNHILDKGRSGIVRTMEVYSAMRRTHDTLFTGISDTSADSDSLNPLFIKVGRIKAAIVNLTYGTNTSIREQYPKVNRIRHSEMCSLMKKAAGHNPDITIVLPHWGEEYDLIHSRTQEKQAAYLAEHGADIIIGTHPHVVQDSMTIRLSADRKVPVIYSIGNAISNMSAPNTQIGLMVTVRAVKHMNGKTEILPPEYEYLWCSLPGRLTDSHCTIPVKDFIGKRHLWKMPYEYDKMIETYERVRKTTGIQE